MGVDTAYMARSTGPWGIALDQLLFRTFLIPSHSSYSIPTIIPSTHTIIYTFIILTHSLQSIWTQTLLPTYHSFIMFPHCLDLVVGDEGVAT